MPIVLTCARCDGSFSVPPSRLKFGNPRFCSAGCWYASNTGQANYQFSRIELTCKQCGDGFTAPASRSTAKFCSVTCRDLSRPGTPSPLRRPRLDRTCEQCARSFTAPAWEVRKGWGRFCGRDCAAAAMRVSVDYVYGPDWAKNRRRALDRDSHTCRDCGAAGEGVLIEVHHIQPKRHGGSNALRNLRTLCRPCHRRIESALLQAEQGQPKQLSLIPRRSRRKEQVA